MKTLRMLVLIAALSLTAVQCAPRPEATAPPETAAPPEITAPPEATATATGPIRGGELRVVIGGELTLLDPPQMTKAQDRGILTHVFQGLTQLDNITGEPLPCLATSWEISEDGLTQTYSLRRGVIFHDGTPFNADAVVANVNRWLDPDFPHASRGQISVIQGVRIVDDYTVEFQLSGPYPVLPNVLGSGMQHMVSPRNIEEFGVDLGVHNPAGTGPFRIAEFIPREMLVVERWDEYWGPEEIYLDRITWTTVPDVAARAAMLLAGEADINFYEDPTNVAAIEADPNLVVMDTPSLRQWFYFINVTRPQLADVRVRQALNHAVNQEALVRVILQGFGAPGTRVIPPGHFGSIQVSPIYEYDPERAIALFEEAGWTRGDDGLLRDSDGNAFTVRLDATTGGVYPSDDAMNEAVVGMLQAIGVTVDTFAGDRTTFFDTTCYDEAALERDELVAIPVGRPEQDSGVFMNVFFARSSMPPNCCNWIMDSNEQLWSAVDATLVEADRERRAEFAAEAQGILWEDVPVILLPEIHYLVSMSRSVHGVLFSPAELHQLAYAWFE